MSPEPLDGSVIVYDADRNMYEPSDIIAGEGGGESIPATDHGTIDGTLAVSDGSHEFTLSDDLAVTVTGDAVLYAHGTGQTLTVAGSPLEINGDVDIVVVTSPREVQSAYVVGGVLAEVTPATPTADDTANTYTIPNTSGVRYRIAGDVVAAGVYSVGNINTSVVVTAEATTGRVLADPTPLADWSWALTFTQSIAWTDLIYDTFAGTNGDPIDLRAPDTAGTGTYTWDRTDAGAHVGTIDANRCKIAGAGGMSWRMLPTPTIVAPATPGAIRLTFGYSFSATGNIEASLDYLSTSYSSAQVLAYKITNTGVISVTGTGVDNAAAALTATAGHALTGNATSGTFVVEIIGTAVKIYINGVHVANGALPGSLRAQKCAINVSANGNTFMDSYRMETGV